jgi:hypothetical protein
MGVTPGQISYLTTFHTLKKCRMLRIPLITGKIIALGSSHREYEPSRLNGNLIEIVAAPTVSFKLN